MKNAGLLKIWNLINKLFIQYEHLYTILFIMLYLRNKRFQPK